MRMLITLAAIIAGLVLIALAISASPGLTDKTKLEDLESVATNDRIDQALEAKIESGDENIPFIAIFHGAETPYLKDIDVKYSYHLINGIAGTGNAKSLERLSKDVSIDGLYLDQSVHTAQPVDDSYSNDTISPAVMVNAPSVWSQGIDGTGIVVAVIDSGIDKNHPDLTGKVIGEVNFVQDEDTTKDLLGHGTLCAGIIAGSGTVSGGKYKGIAPGAKLLNVRVIASDGNGQVSDIIAGIEWALDNDADVLSLSLAGFNLGETNPPVSMAADNAMDAGAVVCVAAGNNG